MKRVEKQFPDKEIATRILPTSTSIYPFKGRKAITQDFYKNYPIRYKYYRWNCGRDQRLSEIWAEESIN